MAASLKGSPNQGLFSATLGFFIGFASVSLFGPTANQFQEVLDLSPIMVGVLVAMPSLSGSLLRIPFSAWVDTTGGRKPFLVLLLISILGMLGLFLVVSLLDAERMGSWLYPILLILGLMCGCGIATFTVGISQVSYWFPQQKQGVALGVYAGVGNLAPGMFSLLLPFMLGSWGLAGSYLAWLIFLTAGTLVYALSGVNAWYFQLRHKGMNQEEAKKKAQEQGQELFPTKSLKASLVKSANVWKTWVLVMIYFSTFGGFIALTAWLPTYWNKYFVVSAVTAGGLTALYSLLTSAVRIAGGAIADRFGGESTAMVSLLLMGIGAMGMAVSEYFMLSVVAEVVLGVGMGVCNAAVFKLVPQEVPEAVGGAAGWVGGLGAFGGFAIPPVMAVFVDYFGTSGYALGFLVFVGLAIVSFSLALVLRYSHSWGYAYAGSTSK